MHACVLWGDIIGEVAFLAQMWSLCEGPYYRRFQGGSVAWSQPIQDLRVCQFLMVIVSVHSHMFHFHLCSMQAEVVSRWSVCFA